MGSGGSHSLWPPGKLFETHAPVLPPAHTPLIRFVFRSNAFVAFTMFETLVATSLRLLLQIKLHRIHNLVVQTT